MTAGDHFINSVDRAELVLAEAAVCERLNRMAHVRLHPTLFNTPLIYDETGQAVLVEIYRGYRHIAREAGVPIFLCVPSWRANHTRVAEAHMPATINQDAVAFMLRLRDRWDHPQSPVLVGGLMGPKNDCYRPQEGLGEADAAVFHRWQAEALAAAGVDVLLAQTLPALPEAIGMAKAMGATGLPYMISFVINRQAEVLDGTPLLQAIVGMDEALERSPYGYMVNCAYPSFICAGRQPASLFQRLIGIQANSSSKDQLDLDGADATQSDAIDNWVELMRGLHRRYGMKVLGGCCGTDERYLAEIADG